MRVSNTEGKRFINKEITMKKNPTNNAIRSHTNYSYADYIYLCKKGYTNNEIIAIWNRDAALGKPAQLHTAKAFDLVGYLNA